MNFLKFNVALKRFKLRGDGSQITIFLKIQFKYFFQITVKKIFIFYLMKKRQC